MTSLLTLTYSATTMSLAPGEVLVEQGHTGGDLYVLESGRLHVERDGVTIARIEEPEALIGEMSALLGTKYTATVKADTACRVRVIQDALRILERQPQVALRIATMLCARLDATSALLVELTREHDEPREKGLLSRVLSTVLGARAKG